MLLLVYDLARQIFTVQNWSKSFLLCPSQLSLTFGLLNCELFEVGVILFRVFRIYLQTAMQYLDLSF